MSSVVISYCGTDWNGHCWDGQQNPLLVAVQLGDLEMCRLLICVGNMNPLSALTCDSEKYGHH